MRRQAPDAASATVARAGGPPQPRAVLKRALGALVLVEAWIVLCFHDTLLAMASIWGRSDTYAHGALVPLISGWLVWRMRHRLACLVPRPAVSAAWLMVPAALLWLVADLAAVNAAAQFAVVALMVLAVPAVLGWQMARATAFPLGFLFFCVPVGDFMLGPLMDWTADFTVAALRLTGVPVYREGNLFHIPSGSWSVVEACSGVRYLIASVVVGSLFAYLNYRTLSKRLIFVAFSVAVPIVANWLRAYLIVMLGHLSGNKLAVGVDHLIYGWAFFGLVVLVMFWIGMRWADADAAQDGADTADAQRPAMQGQATLRQWLSVAVVAGAATTLPWLAGTWLDHTRMQGVPQLTPPEAASSGQGAWRRAAMLPGGPLLAPGYSEPSAHVAQVYERDGERVGLFIAYYRGQTYERKLVSSTNVLVASNDKRWTVAARGQAVVAAASPPLAVRTARLSAQGGGGASSAAALSVRQVYWINGTLTPSDVMAKLWGAWHSLSGRGDDAAVIVAYTEGAGPEADARLDAFLSSQLAAIQQTLAAARDAGARQSP